MEPNIFSPRLKQLNKDNLSSFLRTSAQAILILVFGLLPILFIPGVYTSPSFSKVYFVVLGLFAGLIFLSLSILRNGRLKLVIPPALAFFWLFVLIAIASGLLSGDSQDSIYGNLMEIHTAGFFVLLALVMTVSIAFSGAKSAITRLFALLGLTALLLQFFHVLRLVFGPELLSFGVFTSPTASLIGSFNDLAIFSGLVVVIVLIVLQQISAHVLGKVISVFLVLSSLILLAVINFYTVWLVLGFMSLLMFLYLISKDTWLKNTNEESVPVSRFVLGIVGLVCVTAGAFVISGDYLGAESSKLADINYIEIRPSISATMDITRSVLAKDALLGVGPNRFEDAWRMYKDPVINQTVFWNTNFSAGNGYIPTLFATTGIAGGMVFIFFLIAYLYLGYRTLIRSKVKDYGWYLVGTISFVSALYLWLMAIVYVPGATLLLLAAMMTGISFAVYISVTPDTGLEIDVTNSKQHGLLLIATVLLIIISSTMSVIMVSKQFLANVVYADTVRSFQAGADVITVDEGLKRSEDLNTQDIFVSERAQLRLRELTIMNSSDPSTVDQQRYSAILAEGISLAEQALQLDQSNPDNYVLLSRFYGLLDPAQFEGLKERNEALFDRVREIDPTNPGYLVLMAQYKAQIGEAEAARNYLLDAIRLKNNYTEALFLLSQLDIQQGNTASAIEVTKAMISIEPTNPTRYFQLGVLVATTNDLLGAVNAFETAVSLDNNYANARYFLALTYLDLDRNEDALIQLKIVRETNQDNELVNSLIEQVESGSYQKAKQAAIVPVQDNSTVSQEDDVTTSSELPKTDLVSPVNRTGSVKPQSETQAEVTNNNSNQE